MRRAIRTSVIPILLGLDKSTYKIAFTLFRRYGLISNIFAKERDLASYFCIFTSFHKLPESHRAAFTEMALEKFSSEAGEMTFLLIPCTDEYIDFVESDRQKLESIFIIRAQSDINEDLFPLSAPKQRKTI